jgi:hypothetical protein
MLTRSSLVAASLAALAIVAAPAHSQTDIPAPDVQPGQCTDQVRPKSGFSSRAVRRAKRTHVLRGTARDSGCGVDRVEISIARKVGKRCRYLTTASRLARRPSSCGHPARWLKVKGTTKWKFRLPRKMARGLYVVRTRATDFAGNLERARSHRLRIR